MLRCTFIFFFQAEDGIRDLTVTGVQTCALPISWRGGRPGRSEITRGHPAALSETFGPATAAEVLGLREEAEMSDGVVKILDGNTFVVSDSRGDIEASLTDPTGLFSFDTRFLSKWILSINGERMNPLSVDDLQYFETRFFLVPGTGTVYVDAKLPVI